MQNKLKPTTTATIKTLNEANVRTIMATGDNVLTAISVGKECNIVPSNSDIYIVDVVKDGNKDKLVWTCNKESNLKSDIQIKDILQNNDQA